MTLDSAGFAGLQGIQGDFFEGDGAGVLFDQRDLASKAAKPLGDGLGVRDASAEQEQLGFLGGDRQDGLIGGPPAAIGHHLVFVDDQKIWVAPFEEAVTLGFEGGDDHRGAEVSADIPSRDPDIPA